MVLHDLRQVDITAVKCIASLSCPLLWNLCRATVDFRELDGSVPASLGGKLQVHTSEAPGDLLDAFDVQAGNGAVSFSFCASAKLAWVSLAVVVDGPGGGELPTNEVCTAAISQL